MDLSNASTLIQNSCLQISIVDLPSITIVKDENKNDNNTKTIHSLLSSSSSKSTSKSSSSKSIASWSISNIIVHCYILNTDPAEPEEIDDLTTNNNNNTNNDDYEPITVCEVLTLPHQSLHTSWENLIYPSYIKENIIGYAESALLFSKKGVSYHIIAWNRVLLLHGPPGTGKTSLCRALSHKLSIRLNHIYPSGGYLLEIKSHSLFSKWFSESGKLVAKLFDRIKEMVEDEPNALFCVLIDEVESLASSRMNNGGGGGGSSAEPSDAVRAVNSVLTSLDSIRSYANVLILTTTNITGSIDTAFVDRVDLKQYIGYPCLEARYEILKSCIEELIRVGIVSFSDEENELKSFSHAISEVGEEKSDNGCQNHELKHKSSQSLLLECAIAAKDLSGRSLRKIPFQSHAFFIRSTESEPLDTFLISLRHGIENEKKSREDLTSGSTTDDRR